MLYYINIALFYVALLMLGYFNVALFDVVLFDAELFTVALLNFALFWYCTINVPLYQCLTICCWTS